ncbi:hypothetical protein RR48_06426 [Papilio machaon]|uniref:Uncharacterized protein n=1 Tax=Papilio machaon TaxID=76193 RepID=A0A194R863_PAPMA|nr:hypothetical protein RR48_06426 [Papilio machaon]
MAIAMGGLQGAAAPSRILNNMSVLFVAALFLASVSAKPQVLLDTYGYYAAAPAYVASYSAPLAYSYPYAYAYSYPYAYY